MCSDLFVACKTIENARRVRFGHISGITILNCIPRKSADFPGMPFHAKGLTQFPSAPRMASSTVEAALYSEPAACSTCSCVGRLTAGVSVLPPSAGVVSG